MGNSRATKSPRPGGYSRSRATERPDSNSTHKSCRMPMDDNGRRVFFPRLRKPVSHPADGNFSGCIRGIAGSRLDDTPDGSRLDSGAKAPLSVTSEAAYRDRRLRRWGGTNTFGHGYGQVETPTRTLTAVGTRSDRGPCRKCVIERPTDRAPLPD